MDMGGVNGWGQLILHLNGVTIGGVAVTRSKKLIDHRLVCDFNVRITFVGGKQLSSTGQTSSYPDGKPKLYPPTSTEITTEPLSSDDTATPPSATTVTDSKSATEPTTTTSTSTTTTATETAAAEPEPQPVGE